MRTAAERGSQNNGGGSKAIDEDAPLPLESESESESEDATLNVERKDTNGVKYSFDSGGSDGSDGSDDSDGCGGTS